MPSDSASRTRYARAPRRMHCLRCMYDLSYLIRLYMLRLRPGKHLPRLSLSTSQSPPDGRADNVLACSITPISRSVDVHHPVRHSSSAPKYVPLSRRFLSQVFSRVLSTASVLMSPRRGSGQNVWVAERCASCFFAGPQSVHDVLKSGAVTVPRGLQHRRDRRQGRTSACEPRRPMSIA